MKTKIYFLLASLLFSCGVCGEMPKTSPHYIQTYETQTNLTPIQALKKLQEGNVRFLTNKMRQRDFALQAKTTAKKGQAPFAVILSCMDSRGSPEILFDQGIGDIFSLRVAGNVINDDMLASLEFATEVTGAKVILVMGHSQCGAMDAACEDIKLGYVTNLLAKIMPAVSQVPGDTCSPERVNAIARQNVLNMMRVIPKQSKLVMALLLSKKILIIGAMHDLKTGKINFFDINNRPLRD